MPETAPPLTWLLADPERRRQAWRYWGTDTAIGLFNVFMHYSMRFLPMDVCSSIGAFLSRTSPSRFPESEARAREAWIRLKPERSDPASVDAAMRRLWRCVGRTMAEYSVLDRFWDAGRITIEGSEHLRAARAANKSILLAVLHLGNWETALVGVINLGFPGSGIYLPPENRFDHRIAKAVRDRYKGGQVVPGPFALRAGLRKLREKDGLFAIHVDELIRGRVQAPAFGRQLRTEGNIAYVARLAAMTNPAVIPAYCVRIDDSARFKVVYLPAIEMAATGSGEADVLENVARINAVIEPVIREHLDQWYYVLDFEFED
jgi:KDO2-lipid IV(A) lauroyltransferase